MSEIVLVAPRPVSRAVLAAVLAAGLVGVGLSVENPQWFSGSTSDAGAMTIGPGGPHGGPVPGGPVP